MATQQELQELLRMLTTRNVTVLTAMAQVKSLQAAGIRSIQQIADASLSDIVKALGDAKSAKALHLSCKNKLGNLPGLKKNKRPGSNSDASINAKRIRQSSSLYGEPSTACGQEELEMLLDLPIDTDEQTIRATRVYTNRAPLLLAFAVELLRHTMPEQPLSSRLSLAQAVVSTTSHTRAVNLGLEAASSPRSTSLGEGQPKVRIMNRDVTVLKRGGFDHHRDDQSDTGTDSIPGPSNTPGRQSSLHHGPASPPRWCTSQPVHFKSSTFIARAIPVSAASEGPMMVQALLTTEPMLKTATHNSWGLRVRSSYKTADSVRAITASEDDGESGCGMFIVRLLEEADADDTLIVISRWFGGIMLGPDRWKLMRGCANEALSEITRQPAQIGPEDKTALWAMDLGVEGRRSSSEPTAFGAAYFPGQQQGGVAIYRPESARIYLLKSFGCEPVTADSKKKTTKASYERESELEKNLGLVLGALRLVYESWRPCLSGEQLNSRAWGWYLAVRPEVAPGPAGWGAKGWVSLEDILALRRSEL